MKLAMNAPSARVYEFGDFRLDAGKRLLWRADTQVPLTPRVFDTLLCLVEHRDTVLDKERLMEAVWPDSIVEENNLTQNISTLRRVFGETPGSHRFIVTVPGRGYRFVAEVRQREGDSVRDQIDLSQTATAPSEIRGEPPVPISPTPAESSQNFSRAVLAIVGVLVLGLALFLFWRVRTPKAPAETAKSSAVPISVTEK